MTVAATKAAAALAHLRRDLRGGTTATAVVGTDEGVSAAIVVDMVNEP